MKDWIRINKRFLLRLMAYLSLSFFLGYTVYASHRNTLQEQMSFANKIHQSELKGCYRGNDLRRSLSDILRTFANAPGANPQVFVAPLKALQPVDCKKAYPDLKR